MLIVNFFFGIEDDLFCYFGIGIGMQGLRKLIRFQKIKGMKEHEIVLIGSQIYYCLIGDFAKPFFKAS